MELYKATNNFTYMQDAMSFFEPNSRSWAFSWDDKNVQCAVSIREPPSPILNRIPFPADSINFIRKTTLCHVQKWLNCSVIYIFHHKRKVESFKTFNDFKFMYMYYVTIESKGAEC